MWTLDRIRDVAEGAYRRYHRREYLHPDPLEVVHEYRRPENREVVALTASALALGQVESILKACRQVLSAFPRPYEELLRLDRREIADRLDGFVYRFFRTSHMSDFLFGVGEMLRRYGSLEAGFLAGYSEDHETVMPGLTDFVARLSTYAGGDHGILLSFPAKGSASKRLHLFLRWMVRRDALDLGDWTRVDPAKLLVPVDTHMLRISRYLGISSRKSADRAASEEITAFFRGIEPADPAKYDFALTRAGIHPELSQQDLAAVLEV